MASGFTIKKTKPENVKRKGIYKISTRNSYVIMYGDKEPSRIGILHEVWDDEDMRIGSGKIKRQWDFEYAKNKWIENFNGSLSYVSLGNDKEWKL